MGTQPLSANMTVKQAGELGRGLDPQLANNNRAKQGQQASLAEARQR